METMTNERITEIVLKQREYFRSDATIDLGFRKDMLRRLDAAVKKWEAPLYEALYKDLHKSEQEAYLTEISIVKGEIRNHLRNLRKWARPKRKPFPVALWPSFGQIVSEPLGNTLIVSPWNYPFQLLFNPLVGAISAGCTAILKPSPYVPAVSEVIGRMVEDTFEERYVAVVQGHREVNTMLFKHRYDLIFLTGSPELGRIAMAAAAPNLTPVILELGGKSPCIVDKEADIRIAARRIAWGKTLNGGQTCIAPDYLFLHKDIKEDFVKAFVEELHGLHGAEIHESRHYVRMVDERAFDRVAGYLKDGRILAGGRCDRQTKYIEPTLIDGVAENAPVMTEEIFGPVFPVMTFTDRSEVVRFVRDREKPLAFYYFGKEKDGWEMIRKTSSGGACINDVIMHIVNDRMPFGGVGNSGMGAYHGEESFKAFSHRRSVLSTPARPDMPFRYMPYKYFSLIKKML